MPQLRDEPIVLASASPRRAELLRGAGIVFEVQPADVDESVRPDEPPERYVVRVAEAKARAISARCPRQIVLGADTTVIIDGLILGKPDSDADARRMLRMLSGRTHEVLTGVCMVGPVGTRTGLARTAVEFAPLAEDEIEWYIATGEPADKAGAYAIQGLASRFVTRIDGSYSNVVGLPVALVYGILKEIGAILTLSP
jgi:septum formation protein